jgi:hypothetical protein
MRSISAHRPSISCVGDERIAHEGDDGGINAVSPEPPEQNYHLSSIAIGPAQK